MQAYSGQVNLDLHVVWSVPWAAPRSKAGVRAFRPTSTFYTYASTSATHHGNLDYPTHPTMDLPFIVAPVRKTKTIVATVNGQECSIEFPLIGGILAGEDIDSRHHEFQNILSAECANLADELITHESLKEITAERTAIRIITSRIGFPVILSEQEQSLSRRYALIISFCLNNILLAQAELTIRVVTAAIKHRLRIDWTEDRTKSELPAEMQNAIFTFIESERNTNISHLSPEEAMENLIQTLGKLGEGSDLNPETGTTYTGDAVNSGQLTQNSIVNLSDPLPQATSKRRSSKAKNSDLNS